MRVRRRRIIMVLCFEDERSEKLNGSFPDIGGAVRHNAVDTLGRGAISFNLRLYPLKEFNRNLNFYEPLIDFQSNLLYN